MYISCAHVKHGIYQDVCMHTRVHTHTHTNAHMYTHTNTGDGRTLNIVQNPLINSSEYIFSVCGLYTLEMYLQYIFISNRGQSNAAPANTIRREH